MDLSKCDGKEFRCRIDGEECFGKITIEDGCAYLCQNKKCGSSCYNKRGFAYSWSIDNCKAARLIKNRVTDFVLIDDENSILSLKNIRTIALEKAKESFGGDTTNVDIFINAFELGIEWYKDNIQS